MGYGDTSTPEFGVTLDEARASPAEYTRRTDSRYLLLEGRESRQEIDASKRSPGEGMVAARTRLGAPYAWLLYDFAVGESRVKSGHESYLNSIYEDIYKYGKMYNSSGTVLISGHASPSGVHGQNLFLAKSRAHNVSKTLAGLGTRSRSVSPSWLYVRNDSRTSEIYAVVKGTPFTANQRALCRGVYVVLWLLRDLGPQERFSKQLRSRIRGLLSGRVTTSKYEKIFYYWVIDNWAYLNNRNNKYVCEAYPLEDGLFFKAPSTPLRNDREALTYLRRLHGRFKVAKHRLETKYTGVPEHSALPAGGDPVRCYQQLARWIALDGLARAGTERVFHFISGVAIQRSMNELIEMINQGRFGEKDVIWKNVERYLRQHRIPMRCVKQPMR